MWLSLTKTNGGKTIIDFTKVSHISAHAQGTQIIVNATVPKSETGVPGPLILYVAESFDSIGLALGAKKVRA
ncbi:hypothetical protein [Shinella sp. M31]|uniref:hypothetical protein n=1 Tax=Shinella sp. M31 TaxID=3368615 RepID=UPI003BA21F1E